MEVSILDSCGTPSDGPSENVYILTPGTPDVQDDKRDIGRYDYVVNWEMGTLLWAFEKEAGV